MRYFLLIVGFVFVLSGNGWGLDAWDSAVSNWDDTATMTENILYHAAPWQHHDTEVKTGQIVPDQDWYIVYTEPYRSYEVQVVNTDGDINISVSADVARYNADGSVKLQDAGYLTPGVSNLRGLRWISTGNNKETIAVKDFGVWSHPTSIYDIKLFETTLFCPRFNNAGSQVSVIIIQAAARTFEQCDYKIYFFDESGNYLHEYGLFFGPPWATDSDVFLLSSFTELQGKKGSARIAHACGYGAITAKLVALEPSTGFSFDTPCSYLPR
ncbi:MAG: hypothetical protein A2156_12040 [Deltaproteobacteria bacterium RBG_16_48_10]|nr:MAG: hypothetical protein A2156_12040 [Deltaproteobacteria bacterium RBG_16_48_10]